MQPTRSATICLCRPKGDSSILSAHDRCASQGNWESKVRGARAGHSLRCRKFPFSKDVISALEGRIYFQRGVREKLPRFLKEFDQAPLVRKLEVERMVGEREVVVKLIHSL